MSLSLVGTWRSQRSLAEPHSPAPSFRTLRGVSYVRSAQDNFVQQGHLCPWGARSPPYGLLKRNDDRDTGRHTPSRNGDPQALPYFLLISSCLDFISALLKNKGIALSTKLGVTLKPPPSFPSAERL